MSKRAVIVVRLSRQMEESTSAERQLADCKRFCEQRGWDVVGVAEDLNVSAGSTTPFKRPALREWIGAGARDRDGYPSDPGRSAEYDVLVFWRLDRLVRRTAHLADVLRWAEAFDVSLVSATEQHFDLSTSMGKVIVQLVSMFAEMELEAIQERTGADSANRIRSGKYRGAVPPWGYMPHHDDRDGWTLVHDDYQVRQIQDVVNMVLDGRSSRAVAAEMNKRGELTPRDRHHQLRGRDTKGYKWAAGGLARALRRPTLMGYVTASDNELDANGKPKRGRDGRRVLRPEEIVRNDDGSPLMREPILDRDTFERLGAELDNRAITRTKPTGALLVGVIFCGNCGEPAYRFKGKEGAKVRYRCRSTSTKSCGPAVSTELEYCDEQVSGLLLGLLGESERLHRVWDRGNDRSAELADIEDQLLDLTDTIGTPGFRRGTPQRERLDERISDLTRRQEELAGEVVRPAGWRWQGAGELFSEWWDRITVQERNEYLRTMGVRVEFSYPGGRVRGVPPNLAIEFGEIYKMVETLTGGTGNAVAGVLESISGLPAGAVTELNGPLPDSMTITGTQ